MDPDSPEWHAMRKLEELGLSHEQIAVLADQWPGREWPESVRALRRVQSLAVAAVESEQGNHAAASRVRAKIA